MSYYLAKTAKGGFEEALARAVEAFKKEGFGVLTEIDVIGTMLPCSVAVQEASDGRVEVAAIDPQASMQAVGNPALNAIAAEVRERLARAVASLG